MSLFFENHIIKLVFKIIIIYIINLLYISYKLLTIVIIISINYYNINIK